MVLKSLHRYDSTTLGTMLKNIRPISGSIIFKGCIVTCNGRLNDLVCFKIENTKLTLQKN